MGLKEPYVFKKMIDSKVIAEQSDTTISGLVELTSHRAYDSSPPVLTRIHDELKRHNELLESQQDRTV